MNMYEMMILIYQTLKSADKTVIKSVEYEDHADVLLILVTLNDGK